MKKLLFPVFLAFSLAGCAFTPDSVTLGHTAEVNIARVSQAETIPVSVTITDSRSNPKIVSYQKNSNGMEMAEITATENVTQTIKKAIEAELTARGFPLSESTDKAVINITGNLSRFYNNYEIGFWGADATADFNMNVSVQRKSGDILFTKTITSQEKEKGVTFMGADNAQLSLNKALSKGMKDLFNDPAFITALTKVQ